MKDEKTEYKAHEKVNWRIGWRLIGAAKAAPVYAPGEYESFADADHVAKQMKRLFPGHHFFVDTVKGQPK